MTYPVLYIFLGFVMLILGASWLVSGASALAKKFKVSDLAIGLTIVAFGTSAPELVVNMYAAAENHPDIILGNIIGSNNFNLFVILGITGLIFPIKVQSATAWREIPTSLVFGILVLLLLNNFFLDDLKILSRLDAFALLLCFLGFMVYIVRSMKEETMDQIEKLPYSIHKIVILIILGLIGLVLGGQLVVNNSVIVASNLGISQRTIGLTIVAAGTSLPELVTSVIAAYRKKSDIAIGNVIGSNIFNTLLILPLSALVSPILFNAEFNTEIYLLIIGTVMLFLAMWTGTRKQLDRWEALVLLGIFVLYTYYLVNSPN